MSVNNRESIALTNRDALPGPIRSDSSFANGELKQEMDLLQAIIADSATSIYKMISIPSNARLSSLRLACEALGAGATVNVGAYYPPKLPNNIPLGGTVVNASFFATAVDVSGALPFTDITNESGSNTLSKQQQNLWQALGLAADPNCFFDIVITVVGPIAATGYIALKGDYAI